MTSYSWSHKYNTLFSVSCECLSLENLLKLRSRSASSECKLQRTVDCTVCGLSLHDRKWLVTNAEGEK